jgi:hypothetical protein
LQSQDILIGTKKKCSLSGSTHKINLSTKLE